MEIKLFLPDHVEAVYEYEQSQLPADQSEIQKEMTSWDNPWRKESLDHYAKLGWSFVAVEEDKIVGYILGQTVLFFNNWTQTLWVEHLSFKDNEVGHQLADTVIRWAKTKHLQKVVMNSQSDRAAFVTESFPKFNESGYFHLSTTKLQEDNL